MSTDPVSTQTVGPGNSRRPFLLLAVFVSLCWAPAQRLAAANNVGEDGTVHVPAFDMPLSSYMSDASKRAFIGRALHFPPVEYAESGEKVLRFRQTLDQYIFTPFLERAKARYPVDVEEQTISGVRVAVVTPKGGIAAANRDRVLINLHGGGFLVGAGLGGLVESVPIAALGRIKVISVDYRQGPENQFPAASEDVATVYAALLKKYRASGIGIYGCSAGGELTAMSVAWLQKQHAPMPGAIGIFCATASASFDGDSRYLSAATTGQIPPAPGKAGSGMQWAYFAGADLNDPLVSPIASLAALAGFPPTLLVTGTRDDAFSGAIHTHGQLVKAGVEARLHVWDGMWHAFFYDVDLPESQEAFDVIVKFFGQHLH